MRASTLFLTVAIAAGGCASNQPHQKDVRHKLYSPRGRARAAPPDSALTPATECPKMSAAGSRITVSEIPAGAAIAFTTDGDVVELRRRVHRMAGMHDTVAGLVGARSTERVELPSLVRADATVEDITGGARLLYVTPDEEQLPIVRLEAREHAERMLNGRCPTISVGPGTGGVRSSG